MQFQVMGTKECQDRNYQNLENDLLLGKYYAALAAKQTTIASVNEIPTDATSPNSSTSDRVGT